MAEVFKPIRFSTSTIKLRPYTKVKLAKRLEPLPGLSTVVLQVLASKECAVSIGTKDECHLGIRLTGLERLVVPVDEHVFRQLHLYASIDHADYHIDFELRGKAWREHIQKVNQLTEEARTTMWIHLVVMQIVNLRGGSPQVLAEKGS